MASTTNVNSNLSDQTRLKTHEINTNVANARDDEKQLGLTATGRTVDLTGVDIGAVVKVKGGVGVYREEKQVLLERICMCREVSSYLLHYFRGRCFGMWAGVQDDSDLYRAHTALLHSTNDEVLSWAETSAFRRDVLNVPWVINEQDLKRAARKAEGRGRRRKVRLDRAAKKDQTLESKQKHEHEKAKAQNRETDELSAPARSKLDRVEPRIKGREVRIPPDQQRRLDRGDSWLPAEGPHQSAATLKQDRGDRNPMDSVARKKQPMYPAGRYDALGL